MKNSQVILYLYTLNQINNYLKLEIILSLNQKLPEVIHDKIQIPHRLEIIYLIAEK